MNGVVRVSAGDNHIRYSGTWSGGGNTTWFAFDSSSEFFMMFRGTSIKVYGPQRSLTRGSMNFFLDGIWTNITFNDTTPGGDVPLSPMYHADNMEDGDHQLSGSAEIPAAKPEPNQISWANIGIDYFEIGNLFGDPFDLLSAGPAAQNVPSQAVIVDNSSPEIIYHTSSWGHSSNLEHYYNKTLSSVTIIGASLSYSFDGVAIWYYSDVGPARGFFKVSIDGSTPQRLTARSDSSMSQRLLWSNTSLGPGRHNLTLTHDDTAFTVLSLDFFRVLPEDSSSGELPTNGLPVPPTDQHQMNRGPLAVGLTFGLLALVVAVLGGAYYLYRRKRRLLIELDGNSVSPFTDPPMRQAGQQARLPQDGKRPPPPARPSSAPMATGHPAMAPGGSGLGPPPSYESPMHDFRVGTAH